MVCPKSWSSLFGFRIQETGPNEKMGETTGLYRDTGDGWFLQTCVRVGAPSESSLSRIYPASHPKAILLGMLDASGVPPIPNAYIQQKRGRRRKERIKRQAVATAVLHLLCFPLKFLSRPGSAKPLKVSDICKPLPLRNLPPCLPLTAINHSVMC